MQNTSYNKYNKTMDTIRQLLQHTTPHTVIEWEITTGAFANSLIISCFVPSSSCDEVLDLYQAIIDMSCNVLISNDQCLEKLFIEISCKANYVDALPSIAYMCDVERITDTLIKLRLYDAREDDTKERFIQVGSSRIPREGVRSDCPMVLLGLD
jgi:hypothetical protein